MFKPKFIIFHENPRGAPEKKVELSTAPLQMTTNRETHQETAEQKEVRLIREIYPAFERKLLEAIDFVDTNKEFPIDPRSALKDFAQNFVEVIPGCRALFNKKLPVFTIPYKKTEANGTHYGFYKITYNGSIIIVSPSEDEPATSTEFQGSKPSDAAKAPKALAEHVDKSPKELMDILENKAQGAKIQIDGMNIPHYSKYYQETLNNHMSDCYSRFTASEKASLLSQHIDLETSKRFVPLALHFAKIKFTINFYSNNFAIEPGAVPNSGF